MKLTLNVWRQKNAAEPGKFVQYVADNVSEHMSFLEMLDVLNEQLIAKSEDPIAFDHDCREGICGMCSIAINGTPHGPRRGTTTCQLHMREFQDGEELWLEPWRATAFPVVRDLVVNRSAFDRIIAAGGYVSVPAGSAPDGNAILIPKPDSDRAFSAATCIGCGACVAACPNASASLFTSAKIGHLGLIPQGQPERYDRAVKMVNQMNEEGFGGCTNVGLCEAVCPKNISIENIARMNRDYTVGAFTHREAVAEGGGM